MKNVQGFIVLFYHTQRRWRRREVTDPHWQIERFVYTQVAIQTGDASSIRKLRERVQLKYTKTNVPTDQCNLCLSLSFCFSLAVTYRKRNREREGWKSKESCRSTSFRHSGSTAECILWIFSSKLDVGPNTTRLNSDEFSIFDCGHRFFWRAHAHRKTTDFWIKASVASFLDLKDTKTPPEAIVGYGAVRTPRGGSKIVIWLCELCASVVNKWGWASTNVRMRMHSVWGVCWLHSEKKKRRRKESSFATVWNTRTKANMH